MPCVLITPEALSNVEGPHTNTLKEAGFQIVYPKNPEFTRGLCSEAECIEELSVAEALIAGSNKDTSTAMIAITTSNSTRVNPCRRFMTRLLRSRRSSSNSHDPTAERGRGKLDLIAHRRLPAARGRCLLRVQSGRPAHPSTWTAAANSARAPEAMPSWIRF